MALSWSGSDFERLCDKAVLRHWQCELRGLQPLEEQGLSNKFNKISVQNARCPKWPAVNTWFTKGASNASGGVWAVTGTTGGPELHYRSSCAGCRECRVNIEQSIYDTELSRRLNLMKFRAISCIRCPYGFDVSRAISVIIRDMMMMMMIDTWRS
jgi:hypothetical protein